jgi:hypothetical protein
MITELCGTDDAQKWSDVKKRFQKLGLKNRSLGCNQKKQLLYRYLLETKSNTFKINVNIIEMYYI